MRGFDRSISPPLPLPPPSGVPAHRERERESVNSSQVPTDIICCYPKGFRSQVVVSSLPPCSLSLLRRGAETGAIPARSPVPSSPGKTGLLVPNAAQVAPLQFSSCRWCSSLCSSYEWVQESPSFSKYSTCLLTVLIG